MFNLDADLDAKARIIEHMKNIVELCEQENDEFVDLRKLKEIISVYYELLKNCAVPKKSSFVIKAPKNFRHAKKVIEYIGEHYAEDISLDDMARLAELTPAYFSKYFKTITGTSFTKYLNFVRLEYAIKDMLTRNVSVTDAALENGFANVKSFITTCKRVYGYTPAQYKLHHPEY